MLLLGGGIDHNISKAPLDNYDCIPCNKKEKHLHAYYSASLSGKCRANLNKNPIRTLSNGVLK